VVLSSSIGLTTPLPIGRSPRWEAHDDRPGDD
jgi:hypothetical protein